MMNKQFSGGKFSRLIIILAGIIIGQFILYGPSLIGKKVLLPLDILAQPGIYIPQQNSGAPANPPHDWTLVDLINQFEPARQFAVSEIRNGRFPLWAPYGFAGVPFTAPKCSLFYLLKFCVKSPVILAWAALLAALVGGIGMYFFCRKALRTSFWPSVICAWSFPLTGFFVLWQGAPTEPSVYWLPWIFLCV
jgi:hypothetical protein